MIHVPRSNTVPLTLAARAKSAHAAPCDLVNAGQTFLVFDADVYHAEDVKRALIEAHRGKCAYCERYVFSAGDVEHFRPKGAVQQRRGGKRQVPGYYWLAYEWTNLLLACTECNSRHKRSLFPLANPRQRALHPGHNLQREQPLLIDPSHEIDRTGIIGFRGEVVYAVDDDVAAAETIRVLRLDRDDLNEMRLARLKRLREIQQMLTKAERAAGDQAWDEIAADLRSVLTDYCSPTSDFSAMARAAVRDYTPR